MPIPPSGSGTFSNALKRLDSDVAGFQEVDHHLARSGNEPQMQIAAQSLGDHIATGTVFMNRCDYVDPTLVWSGVKDTGSGIALSRLGFGPYTRPKSFHLKHN